MGGHSRAARATRAGSLLVTMLTACGAREAEPRAQVLITLDVDVPVVGQLADETLSSDAAIDTLRIDVLSAAGELRDHLVVAAPDVRDWPLSFGVRAGSGSTLVRIRAFRARLATTELVEGELLPFPPKNVSIERALSIEIPDEGVREARVRLTGDCIGIPATFGQNPTTCLDANRPSASASDDLDAPASAFTETRAGGWPKARAESCKGTAPPDTICIPGGYSVLGDESLVGTADGITFHYDPAPLLPIYVEPFFMDRLEVTVGRFRKLVLDRPELFGDLPLLRDPSIPIHSSCTWLGVNDPSNDDLPLNCLTQRTALDFCEASGATLPSEAQWEHAARGRGQSRRYVWGEAPPVCCGVMAGSSIEATGYNECPDVPSLPAGGAHTPSAACPIADASRDGVLDLAGSLYEFMVDDAQPYDHSCWTQLGIRISPRCVNTGVELVSRRGGAWIATLYRTLVSLRAAVPMAVQLDDMGFRCVYSDAL